MEKSKAHKALEKGLQEELTNWSNPGNDAKVNIAVGILNAESAEKTAEALKNLQGQIAGGVYVVSTAMEQQAEKMIKSNEKLSASNEKYATQMKWLTFALVLVGIAQVIVSFVK